MAAPKVSRSRQSPKSIAEQGVGSMHNQHNQHNQQQSPFFSKLPSEIRQQIYSYTFPLYSSNSAFSSRIEIQRKCGRSAVRYVFGCSSNRNWHERTWHNWTFNYMNNAAPSVSEIQSVERSPRILLLCWRIYYEAACLLFSTKQICFESPSSLIQLKQTLPPLVFNEIRRVEFVFCSNFAIPLAELNAETFATFKGIVKSMANLQHLNVTLPRRCWGDFFYESPQAPPHRRLLVSQSWEREFNWDLRGRSCRNYHWTDVEPYLGWIKEFVREAQVVVTMFEYERVAGGAETQFEAWQRTKLVRVKRRLEAGSFVLVD